ncbi:unnamed protein product [Arabidopsis arenosa]|uniref:Elicitor peptide n=2 Tax=Arabidopsis TaxID=3701 RepID=A0A8T1YUH4_9BRAS|nr:AT5G09978-like protein [Arabidopsis arenosa]KAG7550127.1 Elicitor peptide [Arabidopsis thaliana x Arabidopsis arenosa]CAE6093487.1 unnamed protein product [Arabidopsis arenosa]
MEGEGRREDGDNCSYLCIPFNFIGDIFRSFFWSLPTPPDNSPISQEEEEETEVVNVTSRSVVSGNVAARRSKQQTSSGKSGGTNKAPS